MNFKSDWLDINQNKKWNEYLEKLPGSINDVYFKPEYLELYSNSNTTAHLFVYESDNKLFLYPFLKQEIPFFSNYFDITTPYGYGGQITNSEDISFIKNAYEQFAHEAKENSIIAELIKFHPLIKCHEKINTSLMSKMNILNICPIVYLDTFIDSSERWTNIYTHANRKNINKANKSNIEITFSQDFQTWNAFETLYDETMKANNADNFYFFNANYYKKLKETLINNYILVTAFLDSKPVSSLLVLFSENYAHCHLIGTSRNREVMNLGVNNLLHHALIEWCKNSNIKYLNIGGGRGNTEDDSLFKFKQNFSNLTSRFYIGEKIHDEKMYKNICKEWETNVQKDEKMSFRLLKYRYFLDSLNNT